MEKWQHGLSGASEHGVPEFGGMALGEGVWAGFRPSTVGEGLKVGLRVWCVEVGPWVGL